MPIFDRKIRWVVGLLAILAVVHSASATATFVFNYLDPAGVGFNDPVTGAARRAALQAVGNQIGSSLGGFNVTVRIDVSASQFDGTGALASCGIRYPGAVTLPTGIWGGRLNQIVTTGVDGNGSTTAEAIMVWDLGRNWYLDENVGGINSLQFDFRSVALHELTHAMGLSSAIEQNGSGFRGNTPGTADVYSRFDTFLRTSNGTPLINGSSAFNLNTLSSITADDIYFAGTNAMLANGGSPVPVYAPFVWDEGSSVGHLDDPADPMYYGIVKGAVQRSWSTVDVGILRDLGYVIVPEPSTIMLAGVGLIGLVVLGGVRRSSRNR